MKKVLIIIIIFLFSLFMIAMYVEPNHFIVKEYSVESYLLPSGFDGIKIVHFSDILYENNADLINVKKMVKLINEQNPDIVVFTGNLLNGNNISQSDKDSLTEALNSINANLYKYYITGSKDTNDTKEVFDKCSFKYLDNSYDYIFNNDKTPIVILGGDSLNNEILPHDETISYDFIITLINKPDYFDDIKDLNSSIVLAGHSLGGQIRIPFVGALLKEDGAKKYSDDYYENHDQKLYISFGVGTGSINMRLFNKPSINVYRLKAK